MLSCHLLSFSRCRHGHCELWRPCIHRAAATTPAHDTPSQRQLSCTKLVRDLKSSIHAGYRDNTPSRHPFTTPIILYKARERSETQYSCGLQRQHLFTTPLRSDRQITLWEVNRQTPISNRWEVSMFFLKRVAKRISAVRRLPSNSISQLPAERDLRRIEILGIGTTGAKLMSVQIFNPEGARHGLD